MKRRGFSLSEWIEQSNVSSHFDSFKLYVIEVYDNEERFIKIGRTFNTVETRFSGVGGLPYSYNILTEIIDTPYRVFNLETKLKRRFKEYKYSPIKQFSGCKECFNIEIKDLIKDIK